MAQKTILSGMRPTGRLHLGNFVGALENWVKLQDEYKAFFFAADWHVLTTDLNNTGEIAENTLQMAIDWLAAGINPDKSTLFVQSQVKEHAELFLLFSMVTTVSRLERNPTLKEQVRDLNSELISYGHLGYPVLQAADVLLYRPDAVPVGEDQAPHLEITREIARKFNNIFGDIFPEPETKMTVFSRLPGLDGKKMSKSLGNTILMADSPEEIFQKVRKAVTDPQKLRKNDPGHPDVCNVFAYHKKFNPAEIEEIRRDCESGVLGCVACKKNCSEKISAYLEPVREKRAYYEAHLDDVKDVLNEGTKNARMVAGQTMDDVHRAMKLG
ncbi:MAG: tryptophan--tRNA ligase [Calditrichia bacterium]